ncbi:lipid-A-disaccharide synthase [Simiduia agarivorans]|uniref:Lipid-A-disaccharide synthase n=1 Tax=Simiduia agarivorans (strain DSM 21679 / JCM 13881 / BCRC 17597 / SA1) TaxID=1117647 RepID=K4KJR6_SIMAS|nr:lipid-A-disaccharide synthase [Simiduia agarivorans]AFU98248.1 lipid-A-disaccharide synthase [Simiduia agarivorans SA1 = DSM 21679]
MSHHIMISAGEASGDLHAANLVRAYQTFAPETRFTGMGSDQLREIGVELLVDCADIAVVGIWEVIKNYRTIKRALNTLIAALESDRPDLLILVDYQEFNFRLAAEAKKRGIKVLFYISPQVWAWRPHRVHGMGEKIDHMAVLFPFEEKFYHDAGVPCTFVGHPLVDEVKPTRSAEESLQRYGLTNDKPVVGLFPGSRKSEVARVLPILLESARELRKSKPDVQFVLPKASTVGDDNIAPLLARFPELNVKDVRDKSYNVMQVCDAIMTASGTATLEIALMGVPNAIVYKIAPLSYWILKRMVTIDNIGLENIVAEKRVAQEFIQSDARPRAIAREMLRLLDDTAYRDQMIGELNQIRGKLGKEGGSANVARLALDMIEGRV